MLKQCCLLLCLGVIACVHTPTTGAVVQQNHLKVRNGFEARINEGFEFVGEGWEGIPVENYFGFVRAKSYVFAKATDSKKVTEALVFSFVSGGESRFKYISNPKLDTVTIGQFDYVVSLGKERDSEDSTLMRPFMICTENGYFAGYNDHYVLTFTKLFNSSFRTIRYIVKEEVVPDGVEIYSYLLDRFDKLVKI